MPADKHEGLNACLCLLRKNVSNFAELSFRSAHHINYRSNADIIKVHPASIMFSLQAPCLTPSK